MTHKLTMTKKRKSVITNIEKYFVMGTPPMVW